MATDCYDSFPTLPRGGRRRDAGHFRLQHYAETTAARRPASHAGAHADADADAEAHHRGPATTGGQGHSGREARAGEAGICHAAGKHRLDRRPGIFAGRTG